MKELLLIVIVLTVPILFCSTSHAGLFEDDIDEAEKMIVIEKYDEASKLIEDAINNDPMDAEIHFRAGQAYMKMGNRDKADKGYRIANKLDGSYGVKVAKIYKDFAFKLRNDGNAYSAVNAYEKAVSYDKSISFDGYDFYMSVGEKEGSNNNAVRYYDKALQYAGNGQQRKAIGEKYLELAVNQYPSLGYKNLKEKALPLVGEERVKQIFTAPYEKIIFEKRYTEDDADEDGWVEVLNWGQLKGKLMVKDTMTINVDEKYASKEGLVSYYKGKEFDPPLVPITNGQLKYKIEQIPPDNSYFHLRIKKGEEVKGSVIISRITQEQPLHNFTGLERDHI